MQHGTQRETAFLTKVQKHQGIIHKICFVYARSAVEREDLYQEIILQLWKSYPTFRGHAEFSTWMYRVALNTAVGMTRKQSLFVDESRAAEAHFELEPAMDLSEDVKLLYNAIARLNKVEKAVILLWLEERSYNEIAATLGITVKNVSVKLVRIKAKLAGIIKKLR